VLLFYFVRKRRSFVPTACRLSICRVYGRLGDRLRLELGLGSGSLAYRYLLPKYFVARTSGDHSVVVYGVERNMTAEMSTEEITRYSVLSNMTCFDKKLQNRCRNLFTTTTTGPSYQSQHRANVPFSVYVYCYK